MLRLVSRQGAAQQRLYISQVVQLSDMNTIASLPGWPQAEQDMPIQTLRLRLVTFEGMLLAFESQRQLKTWTKSVSLPPLTTPPQNIRLQFWYCLQQNRQHATFRCMKRLSLEVWFVSWKVIKNAFLDLESVSRSGTQPTQVSQILLVSVKFFMSIRIWVTKVVVFPLYGTQPVLLGFDKVESAVQLVIVTPVTVEPLMLGVMPTHLQLLSSPINVQVWLSAGTTSLSLKQNTKYRLANRWAVGIEKQQNVVDICVS